MPTKFYHFMKILVKKGERLILLLGLVICSTAYGDPPIEDPSRTFLQLNNGTWLHLKKGDMDKNYDRVEFIFGRGRGNEKKKDIIWSKIYETDDNRAWVYAYFLRLKPGRFVYDLDGDGPATRRHVSQEFERTAIGHGIDSVSRKIEEHLSPELLIETNVRQRGRQVQPNFDIAFLRLRLKESHEIP